jgi:hypothetical protein
MASIFFKGKSDEVIISSNSEGPHLVPAMPANSETGIGKLDSPGRTIMINRRLPTVHTTQALAPN